MKARIYRTDVANSELLKNVGDADMPYSPVEIVETFEGKAHDIEKPMVNIHPEFSYQTIEGFGGAFTEASAEVWSKLSPEKQQEFMEDYFGEDGIGYNFCRTHINSCDFSLEDFFYVEEGDDELRTFDISRDKEKRIPMMLEAMKCIEKANRAEEKNKADHDELKLFASPWTPPVFMKTVDAVQGGHLKKEYYAIWAKYMHRFAEEYAKVGVKIDAFTMQNEPRHWQTWESCNYTMAEEAEFLGYLGRELEGTGIDIWCYDHCRERNYERTRACAESENGKYLKGVANHCYSGDHFGELRAVREKYPDLLQVMSERCERVTDPDPMGNDYLKVAEAYAHDIAGSMNNGLGAYVDWNLTLDEHGGPRHHWIAGGGEYTDQTVVSSPISCNLERDEVIPNLLYYYIGQFSKFVKRGAKNIMTSGWSEEIDTAGFLNPDGSIILVTVNRTDEEQNYFVRLDDHVTRQKLGPHAIETLVITQD